MAALRHRLTNHVYTEVIVYTQVLTAVSSKVDRYATKIPNFNVLLLQARKIMIDRAESLEVETEAAEGRQRSASVMSHSADVESTRSPGKLYT